MQSESAACSNRKWEDISPDEKKISFLLCDSDWLLQG